MAQPAGFCIIEIEPRSIRATVLQGIGHLLQISLAEKPVIRIKACNAAHK
jgi:hypothetical protein